MKTPPAKLALKLSTPIHNGLTTPVKPAKNVEETSTGTLTSIPDTKSSDETSLTVAPEEPEPPVEEKEQPQAPPNPKSYLNIEEGTKAQATTHTKDQGKTSKKPRPLNEVELTPPPQATQIGGESRALYSTDDQHEPASPRAGESGGAIRSLLNSFGCCVRVQPDEGPGCELSPKTEAINRAV